MLMPLEPFPEPPLVRTRYPVVLLHGFGVLSAFGRGGNLHPMAVHLRQHGVWAYAPNVSPYDTVKARAALWARRLQHVLAETRASKVTLVAHSMGGLDARYLISRLGWYDRVAALVTIATPHRGTALADLTLQQPDLLRRLMSRAAEWLGSTSLADAETNFHDAVAELSPAFVQGTFNPAVPDHPDVRYWSYAGAAGQGTDAPINPLLTVLNRSLYRAEGLNDGYVSAASAQWGTYHGSLPADHALQIGISFPGARFRAPAFYTTLTQKLAKQGF